MLAALREGFTPHHAAEICETNLETVSEVFGCYTMREDTTSMAYRTRQYEYERRHGVPTVRCFTPECKDNAALNKYVNSKRNKYEKHVPGRQHSKNHETITRLKIHCKHLLQHNYE